MKKQQKKADIARCLPDMPMIPGGYLVSGSSGPPQGETEKRLSRHFAKPSPLVLRENPHYC
jgi:hypothetical protein